MSGPTSLPAAQLALARSRTYALIGEVLLDGWTERAVAWIGDLAWAAELPTDPDRRAARHQAVFGRAVPPYASVFLSADGLLGGAAAARARAATEAVGLRHERTDVEPDHAGLLCRAASLLCGAEADALRDGLPAERYRALAAELVREQLSPWVRMFATAVARQGDAASAGLVGLLADLVDDHVGTVPNIAPAEPELLDSPGVGLKAVARYLLVPARSGVWWSLHDLQRLADRAGLACGFGRRVQMMESLWFSAVDHGAVDRLVQVLLDDLGAWGDDPRVEATRGTLRRLAAGAAEAAAAVDAAGAPSQNDTNGGGEHVLG